MFIIELFSLFFVIQSYFISNAMIDVYFIQENKKN
jgi:hypothetical protein